MKKRLPHRPTASGAPEMERGLAFTQIPTWHRKMGTTRATGVPLAVGGCGGWPVAFLPETHLLYLLGNQTVNCCLRENKSLTSASLPSSPAETGLQDERCR